MVEPTGKIKLDWKRRTRQVLSRGLRPVEAWVRLRLLLAVDRLVLLGPASPDPSRVLIIRLDNIGDFVVWLDAAKVITAHYHQQRKHVTLLANAVWKDWAEELGLFDEVIAVEEKRYRRDLRYRLRIGRQIRGLGVGTAVQPAHTRILEGGDSVVRVSGAVQRLGPVGVFDRGAERNRSRGDRWYTELHGTEDRSPDQPLRPAPGEMRRNAAFVRALTSTPYKAKVAKLGEFKRFDLPSGLPEELAAELGCRRYFVLFPGATFAGRLWPVDRYVELAERLGAATGFTGVVCGGHGEAAQAAWICERSSMPLLNWVGRTSLPGLAEVLAGAELLVANETSAVHIAAAVGTPSVCILGGGHYGRFMPYDLEEHDGRPLPVPAVHRMGCFGCDWRCVYHPPKGTPVPCIEQVSVEEAWTAVRRALGPDFNMAVTPELTVLQCV